MKQTFKLGLVAAVALAGTAGTVLAQAKTLDAVKARGTVNCGVGTGLAGFGQPDDKGAWTGLDVEFCRGVAAAIFNDPAKVTFKPLSAKERFTALQSGEIDLLARNSTWTISRDSSLGLSFTGINFYDGQGFMVKKSLGVKSAKELKGASICVQTGTTTELNLADYFRTLKIEYKPVVFEKNDEVVAAYDAGRCDSMTTDASGLFAERLRLKTPDDSVVLPEIISKEPLGPVVRQGDSQWFTIVRWVHFAMLNAEEQGVTQANVAEMVKSTNPDIKRMLGTEGEFGKGIGLENDWVVRIVKAVGNYGESYERNVGTGSRLKIDRGLNKQWSNGGLQYAPPIR
jgi:general L-amino acid transport system substrate-binding protein